ncbi:MAG TPA: transcriptional regulator [Bacillus bacterium]|nr:transcriptional regulator [Bacillus sp. (in: firmicutes)]
MAGMQNRGRRIRWGRVISALLIIGIFAVGIINIFQFMEETIKTFKQPFQKAEANHTFEGTKGKTEAVNVLLLGSDTREENRARTDTIMVAHYNPQTHDVKLISLMRDMYVEVPEYGHQKLNAAYSFGGSELLRDTIKSNFGLDIHHYAIVDFKGFVKAVDLLVPNGIEVDIPYEMSDGIGMKLEPGTQQLNGKEMLGYVRFRQDRLSDFGRVQRQQEVITKIKEEAFNIESVGKLPDLFKLLNTYVDTDIDTPTLITIGKDIMTDENKDVETIRIPEDGSFMNKRYDGIGDVLEVDLDENKKILNDFLKS